MEQKQKQEHRTLPLAPEPKELGTEGSEIWEQVRRNKYYSQEQNIISWSVHSLFDDIMMEKSAFNQNPSNFRIFML